MPPPRSWMPLDPYTQRHTNSPYGLLQSTKMDMLLVTGSVANRIVLPGTAVFASDIEQFTLPPSAGSFRPHSLAACLPKHPIAQHSFDSTTLDPTHLAVHGRPEGLRASTKHYAQRTGR